MAGEAEAAVAAAANLEHARRQLAELEADASRKAQEARVAALDHLDVEEGDPYSVALLHLLRCVEEVARKSGVPMDATSPLGGALFKARAALGRL